MNILWKLWLWCGRLAFWLVWPALTLYLRRGDRTRLVLWRDDKLLVVKDWLGGGGWALPGGGRHADEAPLEAVVRELHEETGIVIDPITVHMISPHETFRKYGLRFRYALFRGELPETYEIHARPFEIVAVRWLSRQELMSTSHGPDVQAALDLES